MARTIYYYFSKLIGGNMFCTSCGKRLEGESPRFCFACGVEQPVSQAQPEVTVVSVVPSSPQSDSPASPSTGSFLSVGRVEVGMMTFLSAITFGIFFMVWLYKAMREYRTFSGRQGANLEQYFWGTVIAVGATVVLSLLTVVLGVLAVIAAIVMEALLINEVLKDRDAAAPISIRSSLPSAGLLITLLVLSNVVSLTVCGLVIGIPLAIWFYYQFFIGHNMLIASRSEDFDKAL